MKRAAILVGLAVPLFLFGGCGNHGGFGQPDSGTEPDGSPFGMDGGFQPSDAAPPDGGGVTLIYAHTDTELYTLDPTTQMVVDVGPFQVGGAAAPTITDLAVNAAGDVWVNSETEIFTAQVPTSPGPVALTRVATIATGNSQAFYALGFAPAGVLGSGETLVGGDNTGTLYAIASNGSTTELGAFGTDSSGNPYELSGDIVFYTQNSEPLGLATIRSCPKGTCNESDDILAEIDVAAMQTAYQTKTPGNMNKQLLGSGTGYGRLYGVGAWNNSVYAFSRVGSSVPAQLIQIGASGTGSVLQSFPSISSGWSGAGVTTNAVITILPN